MNVSALPAPFRSRPLLITTGIHLLLLILFILWKFPLPVQAAPIQELGMEVNLGTGSTGSGTDQPMDIEDPGAARATNAAEAAAEGPALAESSNEDDAAVMNSSTGIGTGTTRSRNGRATHQTAGAQAPVQTRRPRFIYNGSNGGGGNSARTAQSGNGEGIAGGPGDQGVPAGTPGAAAYSGTPGHGNGGYSFSLAGRSIERAPTEGERFREGGRVVLRVTVNRDGEIVNRSVKSSTNTELNPIAIRRLQGVRFNKSETAPEEQFGTITFVFKTRQ